MKEYLFLMMKQDVYMLNLNENWLTEEPIDYEYKSYLILAYEQKINENFKNYILYPSFNDLLDKIKFTKNFINSKKSINDGKKLLKGIENGKLVFESQIHDNIIEELQLIAEFAYPIFKKSYIVGEQIFENIYKSLKIFNLALHHSTPFNGILILDANNSIFVYKYDIIKNILETDSWGINLEFQKKDINSAKNISEIIKEHKFNIYLAKYELNYIDNLHKTTIQTILKKKFLNRIVNNI